MAETTAARVIITRMDWNILICALHTCQHSQMDSTSNWGPRRVGPPRYWISLPADWHIPHLRGPGPRPATRGQRRCRINGLTSRASPLVSWVNPLIFRVDATCVPVDALMFHWSGAQLAICLRSRCWASTHAIAAVRYGTPTQTYGPDPVIHSEVQS